MSRLIVKNLPKNITDIKLKELFSQKGIVTDVQLKYTKDGKFRQFAFIGYKTEEQALLAQSYFNQTCIDTSRISVDLCASLGDPSKPRSWSKYANDSSHNKGDKISDIKSEEKNVEETENIKKNKSDKNKENKKADKKKNDEIKKAFEKHKDDPLFMEFLETHTGSNVKAIWKNDIDILSTNATEKFDESEDDNVIVEGKDEENKEVEEKGEEKIADKIISDLEYMEALKQKQSIVKTEEKPLIKNESEHGPLKLFTIKVRGLGYNHMKKHIKHFFHPLKAKSIRVPQKIKGIAYVGFKTELHMKKALMKNKSFLDGKQIFVSKYEEKKAVEANEHSNNATNIKWKKQEETLKNEESIAESGRMFVRNLAYTTTEDDIRTLFEKYGPLSEINLPVDIVTRKLKGFGTVTFLMAEHAVKAYMELDGSILNGRMLHLLPGKAKASLEDIDTTNLTFKQKKDLQNKVIANSSHNWNTLFLGPNAVADAIADIHNIRKEQVLEDTTKGMSAAVKLALGETKLTHDTRTFLEENGVCLDAFNQAPKQRSRTVILVKNLPAQTESREIRSMFAHYGELGRVVMPPTGITALVEFLEPSEARKAFTKLAYTKYKHLPLYLEWAPDNSFITPASKINTSNSSKTEPIKLETKEEVIEESGKNMVNKKEEEEDDDEEPEPDTTLFVKNINFSTTEAQLKEYFGKCGPLHYVTIVTKKDPKDPSKKLSMGYGFIRYKIKRHAEYALKTLQMTVLDEKTLELKKSERTLMSEVKTAKKTSKIGEQIGSKILVRNIPFQATINEINELFKVFGEIKAIRLPRKLVGVEKHKGFAFVEYHTKKDAKRAFNALCQSTHLYGRRLVLEWAHVGEDIDEIRKRTAKHFLQENSAKRFKKATLDFDLK